MTRVNARVDAENRVENSPTRMRNSKLVYLTPLSLSCACGLCVCVCVFVCVCSRVYLRMCVNNTSGYMLNISSAHAPSSQYLLSEWA